MSGFLGEIRCRSMSERHAPNDPAAEGKDCAVRTRDSGTSRRCLIERHKTPTERRVVAGPLRAGTFATWAQRAVLGRGDAGRTRTTSSGSRSPFSNASIASSMCEPRNFRSRDSEAISSLVK